MEGSHPALSAWIVLIFGAGSMIFYVLLCIEKPVWAIVRGHAVDEGELRRVHATLKRLIPLLPPTNGIVVLGGTALLVWQAVLRDGDWRGLAPLIWYIGLLAWIVFGTRIATSVRDVFSTPSDAPVADLSRGVARLIRAHRDGLINTFAPVVLQFTLVVYQA